MLSPSRAKALLWDNLRLVVIDVETVMAASGLGDQQITEVEAAIAAVKATGQPVTLAPARRMARLLQHRLVEAAGLVSESSGDEPKRALTVKPTLADGTVPTYEPQPPLRGAQHRLVSIALVSVKSGRPGKPWTTLVNPDAPVDAKTADIHGLTDRLLREAPRFAEVAPEILSRLQPSELDETVVLVAFRAGFDIGTVLRSELARVKLEMPELHVLDLAGRLAGKVGIAPAGGKLEDLLAALEVHNEKPHSADGDAVATAEAACKLLQRATDRGIGDLGELLAEVGSGTSTEIRPSAPSDRAAGPRAVDIPDGHLGDHFVLSARPKKAEIAQWLGVVDDCARLRCPDLALSDASMVRTALAGPAVLMAALEAAVERRAKAGDGPGAAAALGGITAAMPTWCPMPMPAEFTGHYPVTRKAAIALFHRVVKLMAALPRCTPGAQCPSCASRRPCPRDALARALAPAVLNPTWEGGRMSRGSVIQGFLTTRGRGGWLYHRLDGGAGLTQRQIAKGGYPAGPELAGATTALGLRAYRLWGEETDRSGRVTDLVPRFVALGCHDPELVEIWARLLTQSSRQVDLEKAIEVSDAALAHRPSDSTDEAWASLDLLRQQLAGRLSRIVEPVRIIDGKPQQIRRHASGHRAKRPPAFRFLRA